MKLIYIKSIWTGFVSGLLPALVIAVGALAFFHVQSAEARSIQFHAPSLDIRQLNWVVLGHRDDEDIILTYNGSVVLTITKEARRYMESKNQQLEITSINALALLRAQKEKK